MAIVVGGQLHCVLPLLLPLESALGSSDASSKDVARPTCSQIGDEERRVVEQEVDASCMHGCLPAQPSACMHERQ